MWLAKNGVPWTVIDTLSDDEMNAYCIILGEMEGNRFNWHLGMWEKPG